MLSDGRNLLLGNRSETDGHRQADDSSKSLVRFDRSGESFAVNCEQGFPSCAQQRYFDVPVPPENVP
jgi:hypothetical protein